MVKNFLGPFLLLVALQMLTNPVIWGMTGLSFDDLLTFKSIITALFGVVVAILSVAILIVAWRKVRPDYASEQQHLADTFA